MGEDRQKALNHIVAYLKQRLHHQGTKGGVSYVGFGYKSSLLHLLSKSITIIIIVGQLHFMNVCFGDAADTYWGFTVTFLSPLILNRENLFRCSEML